MVLAAVLTERKQVAARLAEANRRLLDQIAEVVEAKLLADRGRQAAAALAGDNARLYAAEQEARMRAEVAAMDAERANHAKSEFLAVMSHELRTPLNAVVGYTDLMASEVVGPINETQRAQLARVRVSTQHLISLIEGVLALARGDTANEELNIEPVDACTLGRQSAALLEEAAAAKGLSFDLSVPGEPHLIETDATKVRQILINLLANAIKFTDRGAVALTMRPGTSHVAFEVRDTGIGIAPEHLERVFEPFWQVDQSTTRRAGGTGLGLGVTRGLARQLGGDVTLASEPGRGSTFCVILPVRHS
jgi:signal transduction histidine kinase